MDSRNNIHYEVKRLSTIVVDIPVYYYTYIAEHYALVVKIIAVKPLGIAFIRGSKTVCSYCKNTASHQYRIDK